MFAQRRITSTYNFKIFALNKNGPSYEARKKYHEREKIEELDAVDS